MEALEDIQCYDISVSNKDHNYAGNGLSHDNLWKGKVVLLRSKMESILIILNFDIRED